MFDILLLECVCDRNIVVMFILKLEYLDGSRIFILLQCKIYVKLSYAYRRLTVAYVARIWFTVRMHQDDHLRLVDDELLFQKCNLDILDPELPS